ncbi:MAG TPA: carbonic anhydrase family protein [Chloroflexia bacterium]|nr:carbonic anhydrase family protein [Chloroflexia bacterium]
MKKLTVLALFLMFAFSLGQVAGGLAVASQDVHWTYEGHDGPEHWGELSPDFALCSDGKEQTPIDVPSNTPANPSGIMFQYMPSKLNIGNNGHTIQITYDGGSSIEVGGKKYDLLQFHFHALSEHTIDGAHGDMEVHFVHKSADGALAVVGALIHGGAENAAYAPVMSNLPAKETAAVTVPGVMIDADDLIPADHEYWNYHGSLTTPPCSEGVNWLLMTNPLEMSEAQIEAYTTIYDNNYRPIQEFNDRTFFVGGQPVATEATPVGMPTTGSGGDYTVPLVTFVLTALASVWAGMTLSRRKV